MKSSKGIVVRERPCKTANPVMFWTAANVYGSSPSVKSRTSGTVPAPKAGTETPLDVLEPLYAR